MIDHAHVDFLSAVKKETEEGMQQNKAQRDETKAQLGEQQSLAPFFDCGGQERYKQRDGVCLNLAA